MPWVIFLKITNQSLVLPHSLFFRLWIFTVHQTSTRFCAKPLSLPAWSKFTWFTLVEASVRKCIRTASSWWTLLESHGLKSWNVAGGYFSCWQVVRVVFSYLTYTDLKIWGRMLNISFLSTGDPTVLVHRTVFFLLKLFYCLNDHLDLLLAAFWQQSSAAVIFSIQIPAKKKKKKLFTTSFLKLKILNVTAQILLWFLISKLGMTIFNSHMLHK